MSGNLILHAGANSATEEQVRGVLTPAGTDSWTPLPHGRLIDSLQTAVADSGYRIMEREYGLWTRGQEGARLFGLWTLVNGRACEDYQLAIGFRNSHDQTFAASIAVGSRVFVCDNLAFSADIVIARKHTSRIMEDLDRLVAQAVGRFGDQRTQQDARIAAYKGTELEAPAVHDFLLRSVDAKVIGYKSVGSVLEEYRKPRHPEFAPRTAWSLFNCYTEVLKGFSPADLPNRTVRLHGLMDLLAGVSTN